MLRSIVDWALICVATVIVAGLVLGGCMPAYAGGYGGPHAVGEAAVLFTLALLVVLCVFAGVRLALGRPDRPPGDGR